MSLDPQVESLLAAAQQAGVRPYERMTVAEARLAAWASAALQGQSEDVARVDHRFIPGPTADLPLRIYYPAGDGPFPALIYLHGSGWVILNIEIYDPICRSLANGTGCAVIAVNYQKAPEHKFPVPLDDAWATTTWVFDHVEDLNIDPTRVGVAGDSAGGNLAAVTAIRARDEGRPAFACQLLVYPATDADTDKASYIDNGEGYLIGRDTMRWFYAQYLNDPAEGADPRVSPLRANDLSGLPPTLVVTAEYDPLRDDGRLYAERLAAAGVPTRHSDYPGMVHGFLRLHGVLDATKDLRTEIAVWVREVMAR